MVWAGLSRFERSASRIPLRRLFVAAYRQQAPIMPLIGHLACPSGVGLRHAAV